MQTADCAWIVPAEVGRRDEPRAATWGFQTTAAVYVLDPEIGKQQSLSWLSCHAGSEAGV
jgi:hypothetical protein